MYLVTKSVSNFDTNEDDPNTIKANFKPNEKPIVIGTYPTKEAANKTLSQAFENALKKHLNVYGPHDWVLASNPRTDVAKLFEIKEQE